jgi:hypothetical protein
MKIFKLQKDREWECQDCRCDPSDGKANLIPGCWKTEAWEKKPLTECVFAVFLLTDYVQSSLCCLYNFQFSFSYILNIGLRHGFIYIKLHMAEST